MHTDLCVHAEIIGGATVSLPARATIGASGYDLAARDAQVIEPGGVALVPTGLKLSIPMGFEGQVRPRSGLAVKHGVTVLNAPGTIDSDYRGEVGVILINHGKTAFSITRGMRIAQLVFARVENASFELTESLAASDRGSGGFGSTGR
ncbi:MAG: dUTP diphosphatase [Candidatus Riflebacteria bacterium]|nr:dUTP diphosphatase [Candidatus Riflebacteria bacterium]